MTGKSTQWKRCEGLENSEDYLRRKNGNRDSELPLREKALRLGDLDFALKDREGHFISANPT
jgi:hypothetical protein